MADHPVYLYDWNRLPCRVNCQLHTLCPELAHCENDVGNRSGDHGLMTPFETRRRNNSTSSFSRKATQVGKGTTRRPLPRQGRGPRFDQVSSFTAKKREAFAERITGGRSWAMRGNSGRSIDSVVGVGDRAAF